MEIRYSKQAIKFFGKQEESIRTRIKYAIMKLPAGDVKKLAGQPITGFVWEISGYYLRGMDILLKSQRPITVDRFTSKRRLANHE